MDLIKRDSEYTKCKKEQTNKQTKQNKQTNKKKLTNQFSNDVGHLISEK